MQIFADQCVHTDAIDALLERGHNVLRAGEVGMATSSDAEIFDYTRETSRVLFTFDKDFGNITRFDIRNSPGVVILYMERMTRDMLCEYSVTFFKNSNEHSLKGKLFIIELEGTRMWPKP